ncbi:MAG: alanine--tRNA ligase [Planctomycetes bacterium]|nr:alanine--tRNA ligase [Planctomycetota bacterium]
MPRPFTTAEIREAFLAFFADKGCVRYPSAPLVPENDKTTLFTVAGMSQFKDMFLGRGTHPFTRATTSQKCLRVNDIMNVGRTERHHTFFEMLGHFSFNDYFKKEALSWIWEFYTVRLGLAPERLTVSVHRTDDESYRFWIDVMGLPEDRIFKLGDKDNFWPASAPSEGPEGPGGYCSEIFYDLRTNDDPTDDLRSDTGRFVEIGNSVFPQFNVRKPHADGSPNLEQLGRTNVDYGGGLERLVCAVQGVVNNFDIDIFQTIIRSVTQVSGKAYDTATRDPEQKERNVLLRRVADHVRAITFCVTDGAQPSNVDRGYIVRRLIRRATLDIDRLGVADARLHEIVASVVAAMGEAYPEIVRRQELVVATLKAEEQMFRRTLRKGLELFQRALDRHQGQKTFSGDDAFELVTTNGFPKEIIEELLQAKGLAIDEKRFDERWAEFIRISQGGKAIEVFTSTALQEAKPKLGVTSFVGYDQLECESEITLLEADGRAVDRAPTGTRVRFALVRTPFYAESGGQVADIGTVSGGDFAIRVTDTQKDEGLVIHSGEVVSGTAHPGMVTAAVDADKRKDTVRHHSATHLLHSALGRVLGDHVEQQGSKVEPTALRFDFNNPGGLTREQLDAVENWVNEQIHAGHAVVIAEMPVDDARKLGAKAQFGEKYGKTVRVISMGDGSVSRELCGGCHVQDTREIRAFRIVREEASSAGVRRITAVAGRAALALAAEEAEVAAECGQILGMTRVEDPRAIEDIARGLKVTRKELPARIEQMRGEVSALASKLQATIIEASGDLADRVEHLQTEIKRLRRLHEAKLAQAATGQADELIARVTDVAGVPLVAARVDGLDAKAMGQLADSLRSKQPSLCVVLVGDADGKAVVLSSVSKDLVARKLSAGNLVKSLAEQLGGRGGGKPELAQGGGPDPSRLDAVLAAVPSLVQQAVAGAGTAG